MQTFLDAAADLVLGAACPACERPGWGVCAWCRAELDVVPEVIDRALAVPLVAACQYRPLLERVIPRYKDDGALHLSRYLGDLLGRSVALLSPPRGALLVPVPSRPSAVRQRGFDHARRLAARAARRSGLLWHPVLSRAAVGEDQRGLGRSQRASNLDHTMTARGVAQPIVVVDDVATSGASLREAVRALREAGNTVLGAAVVAQAEKVAQLSVKGGARAWRER